MSERRLVATSNARDYRPLSVAGRQAINTYDQLVGYVRRSLSADHAALFAEPLPDEGKGTIDWYAEIGPDARPLTSLDEADQQAARTRLAGLREDINALAAGLSRSNQASGRQLGELLQRALEIPNDSDVMVDGDRIVLVNWGHAREQAEANRSLLEAQAPKPAMQRPVAAPPQHPVDATPARPLRAALWPVVLLWLLFAGLLAGNYYVLLQACAVSDPGAGDRGWWFADFCPVPVAVAEIDPLQTAYFEEQARGDALRNRRDQLAVRIAEERRECRPPTPPPVIVDPVEEAAPEPEPVTPPPAPEPPPPEPDPRPPEPDPPAPDAFDDRVESEGGAQGDYQITLIWEGDSDLDLHLDCGGDRIYYGRAIGCGGGRLDIDANAGRTMPSPVENIAWSGRPPPGSYTVRVDNYSGNSSGSAPVPYRVRIRTPDGVIERSGQVAHGQTPPIVHQFTVP